MIVTKSGIKVVAYVHTAEGLKDVDELNAEEKTRLGQQITCTWLNALYAGKAEFYVDEGKEA